MGTSSGVVAECSLGGPGGLRLDGSYTVATAGVRRCEGTGPGGVDMLDYRGVMDIRTPLSVALVAIAVAGCATAAPPRPSASTDPGRTASAVRCSDADPDRFAWFCLVGRTLYAIAAGWQGDHSRPR
jgi:hypothetical protein